MFGYIAADTRKLDKAQRAEYHSLYCGLCHTLGRRYGLAARLLLSFDTAFLLTLLDRSGEGKSCVSRCPYKFGKRCDGVCGNAADYCADVTVLLACLKFEDDIKDDNSLRARILFRLFKKQYEKARAAQPQLAKSIEGRLCELSDIEKSNETNPDIPANTFGRLLSDVFAYDAELKDIGFSLGRFIYLADAACDFKSDIKKGRYNPLVRHRRDSFYKMLARELGQTLTELDKLNIKEHRGIIENVLYHGVWIKINVKGIYDTGSV